jgi:hypothetical protein
LLSDKKHARFFCYVEMMVKAAKKAAKTLLNPEN